MRRLVFLGIWLVALLPSAGRAQDGDLIALKGATIHTAAGAPIANGTIVLRGGKIVAVGAGVPIPAGAKVNDAAGKVIIPGMIDNHSHIGAKATDLNDPRC